MMLFGKRRAYELLRRAKAPADAVIDTLRSKAGREARRQIAIKDAEIMALRRDLARARGGEPSPDPIGTRTFFVMGYQKSGTTWLMRMLDSHPQILCKGEGRFFGGSWRQESVRQIDVKRPPSSLYNALLDAEYLRLWIERSVWSRNDDADEHLSNLTRMAIDYFLLGELSKTRKRIVGDKSPLLIPETMREIAGVYPEARVVHIIRDGRDAAVSAGYHSWNFGQARKGTRASAKRDGPCTYTSELQNGNRSMFAEGQLRKLAREWGARVSRTVEDGPVLFGRSYVEVRYEELLERTEDEARRLLEFLGAEASEKTVKVCVNAASFEKLSKGRKRGEEDPTSFFRKGVAGDWRSVFTDEDKHIFKEEAGELLIQLGYEKDDNW